MTPEEYVLVTLEMKFPREDKPKDYCTWCSAEVKILINTGEHVCSENCRKRLPK